VDFALELDVDLDLDFDAAMEFPPVSGASC